MKNLLNRRDFIKTTTATGLVLSLGGSVLAGSLTPQAGKRVGIIGLDTSHSIAFTKVLNADDQAPEYKGYKVVAAYPYGSKVIKSSADRIPGYIEDVKKILTLENTKFNSRVRNSQMLWSGERHDFSTIRTMFLTTSQISSTSSSVPGKYR